MTQPELASVPRLPWTDDAKADGEPRRAVGTLTVGTGRAEERAPLPLAAVAITARVADRVAEVTLTETFHNPYPSALEAIYVVPLAGGGAVCDFELRVGSRVLRGEVQERGLARQTYQQAIESGHRAALLEQERDDVFTVKVGNLPPGEEVSVRLTYAERLPFREDGTTELRLPLVVAPRYVPGEPVSSGASGAGVGADTDLVPDASRITPPRLAPGFDPRVALTIDVELLGGDHGAVLAELACSQHATRTATAADRVEVSLARQDEALDRDFVLRWRIAGERVSTSFLVHRGAGEEAGYGLLSIVAPRREGFVGLPRDVVFVLDRSGSMDGIKMISAARACSTLLATLGPRDRFTIQAFDNEVEWMPAAGADGEPGGRLVAAGEGALERGHAYLRRIEARGGTELDAAVAAALEVLARREDAAGRAAVLVLLTDGQVGDEHRVLRRMQEVLGEARVFTVGIDTAVNAGFLTRLAALGGGTAAFVEPGTALERALGEVAREIGVPLVVDLAVEDVDAGVDASSLTPARLPDLFAGRGAVALLRVASAGRVRLTGRFADGTRFSEEVAARPTDLPALAVLWARSRVRDLEDRYRLEPARQAELERQIVELGVRHRLLTRFTAFVVVDEAEVVSTVDARTVVQPVATPAQWAPQAFLAAPSPVASSPSRGGIFRKLAQVFGHDELAEMAMDVSYEEEPSASPAPPQRPAGSPPPSAARMLPDAEGAGPQGWGGDPHAVAAAMEALHLALELLRSELDAGRTPAPQPLAAARAKLLAALAGWEGSVALPVLQRFLRAELPEVIVALATPNLPAAALQALVAKHLQSFALARREALAALGGSAIGPSWGATV